MTTAAEWNRDTPAQSKSRTVVGAEQSVMVLIAISSKFLISAEITIEER